MRIANRIFGYLELAEKMGNFRKALFNFPSTNYLPHAIVLWLPTQNSGVVILDAHSPPLPGMLRQPHCIVDILLHLNRMRYETCVYRIDI